MEIKRFEVYLVVLDPAVAGIYSTPCVVISPDEMNRFVGHIVVAPITTNIKKYPTRVSCKFQEKEGSVVLDQIRTVDKIKLVKLLGILESDTCKNILCTLQEMFS